MKKLPFVTLAEYAASEFDFRKCNHQHCRVASRWHARRAENYSTP